MRKLLIGVGAAVGLVVGLGFAAPLLIDLNDQKPRITALIEEATGHQVVLGGNIRFTLLPVPAVSVRDVRVVGDSAGAPDLASVQAIDLRLNLLALLGGKVDVAEVRLSKPVLVIAEAALPALAAPADEPAAATGNGAPGDGQTAGGDIAVQRVLIEDGMIEWRPAQGEAHRLEGLEANLSAPSLHGPYTISGGAAYRGQPVAIEVALGRFVAGENLAYDVKLALAGGTIALGGSADLLAPGGPSLQGRLRLAIDDAAAIGALTGINLPAAGAILAEGKVQASRSAITVDDLALTVGESRGTGSLGVSLGPTTALSLKLRLPRLDGDKLLAAAQSSTSGPASGPATGPSSAAGETAAPRQAPAAETGGPAGWSLPRGVTADVDLAIDALQWSGAVVQKIALVAALEGGRLTLSRASAVLPGATDVGLSGAAVSREGAPRFEGTLDIASDNPRALTDWLKLTPEGLPADRLTRFALTGKVNTDGRAASLTDLVIRLDGSTAKGRAGWEPGTRPTALLALDIDRLDADGYLTGMAAPPPVAPAGNPLAQIGSAAPASPLPHLPFDLALRLKLGSLLIRGGEARDVGLDGLLTPDTLRLAGFSVRDYAGLKLSANGKLGFAREAPDGDFAFRIEAPSPEPLLALAGLAPPVQAASLGRLTVEGRLTGRPEAPVLDAWATVGETRLALAGPIGSFNHLQFDLKGTLGAPELLAVAAQAGFRPPRGGPMLGPLDLAITLRGTTDLPAAEAKGRLGEAELALKAGIDQKGVYADGRLDAANGAAMLNRLGLTGPVTGALALSVEARGQAGEWQVAGVKATVGPNRLETSGTLSMGDGLRFKGRLNAPYLDLALFSSGASAGAAPTPAPTPAPGAGAASGTRWSTKPIDLQGLRRLDGTVDVTIDRLLSGSLGFSGVTGQLTAAQGVVTLGNLKASTDPGLVAGTVTLDASGEALGIAADLTATGFDLDALTGRKGTEPGLAGTGDLTLALAGLGRSPFEIVSSLSGKGNVLATDGRLHGLDLKTLSEGLKTVNQAGDVIGRIAAAVKVGSTAYRRIGSDLLVERGIAKLANVISDIDGGSLGGEGAVDLPAWTSRVRLALRLAEPADLPALGIEISGPPDAPTAEVRTRDLENYYLQKFIGSKLPAIPGLGSGSGSDPGKAIVDQIFKGLGGK